LKRRSKAEAEAKEDMEPMRDEKILVIDDQRSHLRLMKRILEKFGKRSVTVDSAEEAEFILEWNSDYEALITDLKMPWLNGIDFCRKTKRKYPGIKIYALSGNVDAYSKTDLEDAGFDGIYQKPIRFDTIKAILDAIQKSVPERGPDRVRIG
jgi:CheY-like chemotaxis protein